MLVTLKEILKIAEAEKIAIGSFNTPNLESLTAVLDAAQKRNTPVIIMHAQVHEEMQICKMDIIAPIMLMMAEKASVPVCVHLDHGTDLAYIKRGLELGFTSVMFDGSQMETEKNYAYTSAMVEIAKKYGASVEAEIGSMGSREGGDNQGSALYTDPKMAEDFVRQTGIDALACAFGTAHGLYLKQPKLDFDRLDEIHQVVPVPIVMHGGSGVSEDDYRRVIALGVRKINYYTYMAKAGGAGVADLKDKMFYHDITVAAKNAMEQDVGRAIDIFTGK